MPAGKIFAVEQGKPISLFSLGRLGQCDRGKGEYNDNQDTGSHRNHPSGMGIRPSFSDERIYAPDSRSLRSDIEEDEAEKHSQLSLIDNW